MIRLLIYHTYVTPGPKVVGHKTLNGQESPRDVTCLYIISFQNAFEKGQWGKMNARDRGRIIHRYVRGVIKTYRFVFKRGMMRPFTKPSFGTER